jgi:lipoprotein-anchoring transpeptidase ErfK/SrfK
MKRTRVWGKRFFRGGRVAVVFVGIAAVVTLAAAASTSRRAGMGVARGTTTTTVDVPATKAALTSALTFAPQPGATGVAPDTPVVVQAHAGSLLSVHLTGGDGSQHFGAFARGEQWHTYDLLAYGTTYHVTATVAEHGVQVARSVSFQTLAPAGGVTASVFPNQGLTVGVGQPVVFRFSSAITNPVARASVVRHFNVTVTRPIVGGWYWFSPSELHFRPRDPWPTGAKVTVKWDLTGWRTGTPEWGFGTGSTHFTIGDARVSFVDLNAHKMTVTLNGRIVATFPISGGKPKDPTMGGTHIVLDREHVVHMVSSTVGIPVNSPDGYDELVYSDVHISDSGEYVHAAPWSVASQGVANVSHGCVNLSPTDADAFFNFSRVGDLVLIQNSPRPPELGDHGVMDWDTPATAFMPGPVLVVGQPPVPVSPRLAHR